MTEDAASQFAAMMPFAELLGIELEHASAESVVGRLRWREDL